MSGTQKRVFFVLAVAILFGALLDLPYTADILRQKAWAMPQRVDLMLFVNAFGTMLLEWLLAGLGLVLAARIGLGAPVIEAWIERRPAEVRRTIGLPFTWGLLAGTLLLVVIASLESPLERYMRAAVVEPPWWKGVFASFAAGIGEEVMTRLFLLSALAVALMRAVPRGTALWTANVLAALAFGALHFANVYAVDLSFNPVLVTYILVVNGGIGLLCGWLFWTRGIEAAMACHVAIDLILHGLGAAIRG